MIKMEIKKVKTIICIECNIATVSNNHQTKLYCGLECGKNYRRHINKLNVITKYIICIVCGKQSVSLRNQKKFYCSRECGKKAQHARMKKRHDDLMSRYNTVVND